ncbi:MAG: hypothetical protein RLZZ546_242 [Bacteroidota bacterium]
MESLINYKKKIVSRYIPIEGNEAIKELPESEEYVYSEKIDGHLAYAVVKDNEVKFYNRSATPLTLPKLQSIFPKDKEGIWAGELHLPEGRSRVFAVTSAIASSPDDLHFAVFDAIHELNKPVLDRIKLVESSIKDLGNVRPIKWIRGNNKNELIKFYQEHTSNGSEGAVVHSSLGMTYKIKPSIYLDLTVIGYSLKEDGSGLRALLVGFCIEGEWVVLASVGGGYSEQDRVDWLPKLQALEVNADIVLVANNKMAYKWVKPQIVIQIKCLEIINEDSLGFIKKDRLQYDSKNLCYVSQGKVTAASLISPVFMGEREDKMANEEDSGIKQITDRIEIGTDQMRSKLLLAESEVVMREVYIKPGKGGTAVRKFIGMKTNKTLENNFTPYYFYYTDFSSGRKEPLQTEIELCSTEEKLKEIFQAHIEENVKKGWEKA